MDIRATSDFRPGIISAALEQIIPLAIDAVQDATTQVEGSALQYVPRDTGELADSIGKEVALVGQTVQGTVYALAPHAPFVEFGTGLVGEANPHPPLPTEGVPFTGAWVYDFRQQGWIGMAAQPFLRPALDVNAQNILIAFRRRGFSV